MTPRMPDATPSQVRSHSAQLSRQFEATTARSALKEDIADAFRIEWLRGEGVLLERVVGQGTLAEIVSEDLCDVPGNQLHRLIELVREQAHAGNPLALSIVREMAAEHAETTVDLREKRGVL